MMFLERLISTGMDGNPYWYNLDYNWFAKNDLWLPNCTNYCNGRSDEIAGKSIKAEIPRGNAQTWYNASKWVGSKTPRVGAICIWGGGSYGHVAIVERLLDDGKVLISQSNYNRGTTAQKKANYFQLATVKPEVGKVTEGIGWKFIGYLVNPYANDKRVSRDKTKYQVEVIQEKVRARKSAGGDAYTGLFIPLGIYNVLEEKGDWLKVDDNVWFSKGSWAKLYPAELSAEQLKQQVESLNKSLSSANSQIVVLENRVKSLTDEKVKALSDVSKYKADLDKANASKADAEAKAQVAQKEVTTLKASVTTLETKIKAVKQNIDSIVGVLK